MAKSIAPLVLSRNTHSERRTSLNAAKSEPIATLRFSPVMNSFN